jgi:Leucine-rich repeat (LRR) protein
VRGNRINALPESVRRLHRLTYLDLRANGITSLPDGVADLPLEKLDLRWNPIERYPVWLDQLEARGCVVYR